jgi:hypothetical protein
MQFRWVAFIALWTWFIGPILGPPSKPAVSVAKTAAVSSEKNKTPTAARPNARR